MSNPLIHFPLYIGDTLKKFIEFPTLEERGSWLSIIIGLIENNGILIDDKTIYYKCLIFNEKDKQVFKQVLNKCLRKTKKGYVNNEITDLITRQKQLRDKRAKAGRIGGKISQKNKQVFKQSESESDTYIEPESEPDSEPIKYKKIKNKKTKISLDELSVEHVAEWLNKKRQQGIYVNHNEHEILDIFKNYCLAHGKNYADYRAAYRNAFNWKQNQQEEGNNQSGKFAGSNRKRNNKPSTVENVLTAFAEAANE